MKRSNGEGIVFGRREKTKKRRAGVVCSSAGTSDDERVSN